jgi:hypothetical protein
MHIMELSPVLEFVLMLLKGPNFNQVLLYGSYVIDIFQVRNTLLNTIVINPSFVTFPFLSV